MTPGDEAGALREEEEAHVDSPDSAADAHDDPAPAEPDPGATPIDDDASEGADEASGDTSVETDASAEAAPAEAASADEEEAPVAKTRAEKKAEKAAAKAEKARLKAERAAAAAQAPAAAEAPADDAGTAEDEAPASDASGDDGAEAGVDEDETEAEAPRPAGAWAASVAVLVVLLIAGLVTAGLYWTKASSASADANGKQAAISTAETAVTDLFTIDYKNPNAWAANLKKLAAGQFLGVISNSSSAFAKIIPEGKVQTTGKAQLAGVESYKGDTAQVAVLGYEIIKNSQNPQGSERPYHMVLSMVKSGSNWVVSNLEFVQ